MRKNYTLSNLLMAAAVLLVASLPCFAQVTANDSTSVVAVADNGPTLALNKNSRVVPSSLGEAPVTSKNVSDSKRVKSLSPALFNVPNQFSMDSKFFSTPQLTNELDTPDSRQQFRLDDDKPIQKSRVNFVPSRGFRLPN